MGRRDIGPGARQFCICRACGAGGGRAAGPGRRRAGGPFGAAGRGIGPGHRAASAGPGRAWGWQRADCSISFILRELLRDYSASIGPFIFLHKFQAAASTFQAVPGAGPFANHHRRFAGPGRGFGPLPARAFRAIGIPPHHCSGRPRVSAAGTACRAGAWAPGIRARRVSGHYFALPGRDSAAGQAAPHYSGWAAPFRWAVCSTPPFPGFFCFSLFQRFAIWLAGSGSH